MNMYITYHVTKEEDIWYFSHETRLFSQLNQSIKQCQSVVRATIKINGKGEIWSPYTRNALTDRHQNLLGDYIADTYQPATLYPDRIEFHFRTCVTSRRYSFTRLFLFFFENRVHRSSIAKKLLWTLTQNTPKDAIPRKDVPSWGQKPKCKIYTHVPRKLPFRGSMKMFAKTASTLDMITRKQPLSTS